MSGVVLPPVLPGLAALRRGGELCAGYLFCIAVVEGISVRRERERERWAVQSDSGGTARRSDLEPEHNSFSNSNSRFWFNTYWGAGRAVEDFGHDGQLDR